MNIQDYRPVDTIASEIEGEQQAQPATRDKAAEQYVPSQQNEAPPQTGSKQWKAFYETISNYARELRNNKPGT